MPKFKDFKVTLRGTLSLIDDGEPNLRERAVKKAYKMAKDLGQLEVIVVEKIGGIFK